MRKLKYIEIAKSIEEDILNNYKPEDLYLSIPTLKTKYGISLDTVNKALDIIESKGLIKRIFGKGTFVNNITFQKDISVLVLSNYEIEFLSRYDYLRETILGINQYVYDKHIKMAFSSFRLLSENPKMINDYDGAIVFPPSEENLKNIRLLTNKGFPCISVTNRLTDVGFFNVDTNTPKAIETMLSCLKEKGHKKIGFINDTANLSNYHDKVRMQSYLDYGKKMGLETKEEWIVLDDEYLVSEKSLEHIKKLSETTGPTAYILSSYNYIIPDFLKEFFDIKHKECEKLSVIGFDEPIWLFFVNYNLTYIKQDFVKIGYEACKNLVKIINGNRENKKTENIPFSFIEGETVFPISYSKISNKNVKHF